MQKQQSDVFLRTKKLSALPLAVTLCGVIALTFMAFWVVLQLEKSNRKKEFKLQASNAELSIQRALDRNIESIESIVALYNASETVERQEFQKFVEVRLLENSAIKALEWIPRIPSTERETYEQAARQEGFPNFQITERNLQGQIVRASQRLEYFPIYYIEPFQGNEPALGFDLASNPARLKAMNQARDQNQAIATAPIDLVQETLKGKKGILIFLPIFRQDQPINSIPARRQNLEGFTLSIFLIEDLMNRILDGTLPKGFEFYLLDQSLPQSEQLLYAASSTQKKTSGNFKGDIASTLQKGIYYTTTLDIAERKWLLIAKPNADSIVHQSSGLQWLVLASGGVVMLGSMANSLAQALERRQAASTLKKSEARFRALVTSAPVGIYQTSFQGECEFVNARWQAMTGLTIDEAMGTGWSHVLHPEDRERIWSEWSQATESGIEFESEYRFLTPQKKVVWVYGRAISLRDDAGTVTGYLGIVTDISDRKRAEEELQQLNQELSRSNQELGQFAYVASHDLQEPLRKIKSFTELLVKRYPEQGDEKAERYMNHIMDGTHRMQLLIRDLLTYSRAGRAELNIQTTDLNEILEGVKSDLAHIIAEREVQIDAQLLPTLSIDPSQMRQLFQNLISNAIKYCQADIPKVLIRVVQSEAFWTFTVQDNGIGIDPKYADRIFVIFQRLHNREAYSGTGIGLAVCKKIIERHGGKIWLDPSSQTGSTFMFTLPSKGQIQQQVKDGG
ncbi:Phytochrome-like protein cph1 [Acaryochloris thomasi RCC1774]|uniref:histidine kinase n=1 Tax=Acaryochloris thomasi RCC1774 TaxID=1764569 RepID=A0A2W1J8J6_9CYAN|nr:CHASE domain-containing protein [Acaryochloris thomasi]PZD70713.1 Phytochrome-like protein cph1 [Acaryochloris thomasi RCC1774]